MGGRKMPNENLTEKVSVNINTSTLSSVDLLVDHGYYSNRSDFINQALRRELEYQSRTIERIVEQKSKTVGKDNQWFIGLYGLETAYIQELHAQGKRITLKGYGVLSVSSQVDREMLFQTVESISIKGRTIASPEIKAHYGLK